MRRARDQQLTAGTVLLGTGPRRGMARTIKGTLQSRSRSVVDRSPASAAGTLDAESGRHALLLQIAAQLDASEQELWAENGLDSEEYLRYIAEGSSNVADNGMFSVQARTLCRALTLALAKTLSPQLLLLVLRTGLQTSTTE